ncbi:uncharacterized protein isoform X2 [Leptinotarsa decemlineata]|uniref:uncharacterized protein isoform X2 n=1 Tax=Leptinotarsa decemlineata TaxID=7539 RepID=UPI003D309D56
MALRNTKIVRELLSNNYKCFSNRAEIISPFSNNKGNEITETEIEHEGNNESAPFRYIVTHTQRPSVLPKIEFPKKEPEELIPPEMRYLQPSMLPKFMELREVKSEVEWEPLVTENKELECPFPEPIRELRTKTLTVSDMKKAELKSPSINVNFKNNNFSIINRNYSTSPYLIVSRTYAKTSKKGNEKCEDVPKKKCVKNTGCPSFIMRDCPVGKPKSDCFHHYTDPKCTKKLAPYPSYSESCAERLEDDPSECMQCPWQKCGGVESIKPPRRSYHTSIAGRQNLNSLPGYVINDVNFMPSKECNTKKEPCKRPPGKCEKRGEKKKEKCPEKKKKCDGWTSAYGFWSAKENILPSDPWLDIESDTIGNSLNCEGFKKFPYDKSQADYDEVSKRKCQTKKNPKCQRKKRKTVPDGCISDGCHQKCMCHNSQIIGFEMGKNSNRSDEKKKCPTRERKCPVVDTTVDMNLRLDEIKNRSHPPPCPTHKKPSRQCPKEEKHKPPYRQERDLNTPHYRKNKQPYPDH